MPLKSGFVKNIHKVKQVFKYTIVKYLDEINRDAQ